MPWFSFSFNDFAFAFLSVLFEGIPFLLLGSLISGLVDVFVSSERLARLLPKNLGASILLSGLLGLVFPMCECGSVIVIRRFIRKGLPLPCAVTYMLGAPIVSPVVALSTFAAFKGQDAWAQAWWMTGLRLGLGFAIAVAAGFLFSRFRAERLLQPGLLADAPRPRSGFRVAAAPTAPNAEQRDSADIAATATLPRKLLLAVQSATADFLDVGFFFIIGVAITSVFNTAINQSILLPLATSPGLAIMGLMGLAALLALCSTTDAFVAASFLPFPFSAKLAFLLFGPMFDLKLFWLYGLLFRRRLVVLLALGLFAAILFACWQLHPVLESILNPASPLGK